ncbi:MAG: hypothetical protein HY966_04610 [Ignavibacteriales bacterium]|nr:hypothetical protein [Ignavibacteriales bacterium]
MAEADFSNTIRFRYKFQFDDGTERQFDVLLDSHTLKALTSHDPHRPEWTKLKFHQCENCPLDDSVEYCPIAVNVAHLIDQFKSSTSYDRTWVVVEASERTYAQETSVQNGLASIMGIYMVTSDCPILDMLRPMVRFHLPFATAVESVYRSIGMYLIAQHFRMKNNLDADWKLDRLSELYKEIAKVNKGFWNRLSNASNYDANVNALIVLSTFGDAVRFSLKKDLDDIAPMFQNYLSK